MNLTGEKGVQEFEIGKIYKGVQRLINAVWTVEFIPTRDGIFIVKYSRKDEEGYDKEKDLPQTVLIEDDKRTVTGIQISDPKPASFQDNQNSDTFTVINPDHVFSYDGDPSQEDLQHPDLRVHRSKWVANRYGVGESKIEGMKHLILFENFRKKYMESIPLSQFEKIEKGSSVMYMGAKYEVVDNNGAILTLKHSDGSKKTVNFSMFNHGGGVFDDTNK
jgi:hypothetical protein